MNYKRVIDKFSSNKYLELPQVINDVQPVLVLLAYRVSQQIQDNELGKVLELLHYSELRY